MARRFEIDPKVGMLVLAAFLIVTGLAGFTTMGVASLLVAGLALLAGILILVGR